MRWTALGTALALALAAFSMVHFWGYSPIDAIFLPAAVALIIVGITVTISVAASNSPTDTAREFRDAIYRDLANLAKLFRSWRDR